jgi:hypothetical protein
MQEAATRAHKVIITGTGRSGTTFLVRLLTELGLDTGINAVNWDKKYFENCHAGLEHNLLDASTPYIVKNPSLCETLPQILETGRFVIDHAFIPIRALDAAAASRIDVGGANGSIPGGLWKTADPSQQKAVLAENFHTLIHTLVQNDIPMTFIEFPRLVNDSAYTFAKLEPLLGGVGWMQFRAAFYRIADPSLVHDFRPGSAKVERAPIPKRKRGFISSLLKPLISLL